MKKIINKLRILGSGFTAEEYHLYRFDLLDNPDDAMRFISNRLNHKFFQSVVNNSVQKHVLEDKWIMQQYLSAIGLPVPKTYGLFHPVFGTSASGYPLNKPEHLAKIVDNDLPATVFIKPRGGRQAHHIFKAVFSKTDNGQLVVTSNDNKQFLEQFINSLPGDAFGDYGGAYHGWLVQAYIQQHEFLSTINPYTINTLRVITFIDSNNNIQIQHAILRLGRYNGTADNWTTGGLSVAIDTNTGRLGHGILSPHYGHGRLSVHPDTGVRFEGEILPEWPSITEVCQRAASQFSGVRTIGWDIALSPRGPVIIEGNADWGVPSIQIHTNGYLTPALRQELHDLGLYLPERARSLPCAMVLLIFNQWQRSRGNRIINRLKSRLYSLISSIGPKTSRPRIFY